MPSRLVTALLGAGAGLVAAFAMDRFQALAAPAFGMDKGSNDDPSTIKAADSVSKVVEGRPVTQKRRETAGVAMHYGLGAALGISYALAVRERPEVGAGYGLPFGVATTVLLDDLMVPAAGWGPWPEADVPSNAYNLASHLVFAATLDAGRRLGDRLLA